MLFEASWVRRAVGAQEEAARTAGRGIEQCLPMLLSFEYGKAIPVGPYAALKDGIAVVEQMMGSDRRRNGAGGFAHVIDALAARQVLEYHLELGEGLAQRDHDAIDENRLAVEKIDVGIRDLAMH